MNMKRHMKWILCAVAGLALGTFVAAGNASAVSEMDAWCLDEASSGGWICEWQCDVVKDACCDCWV